MKGVIPSTNFTFDGDHTVGRFFPNISDYKADYSLGSTKSTSALDEML